MFNGHIRKESGVVLNQSYRNFELILVNADPSFEERLSRLITEAGIPLEIEGSELHAN